MEVIRSGNAGSEAQVREMVALLLAHGADPTVEFRGRDALGWARGQELVQAWWRLRMAVVLLQLPPVIGRQ